MELLRQSLRISFHGSGDHSGDLWARNINAPNGFAGAARRTLAEQWRDTGLAATAVEGDTPHRGAHVA